MNTSMNGNKIKEIELKDCIIKSYGQQTLYLSATHHGDRDEFWVIRSVGGHEVDRFNCRTVEVIVWEKEN